MPSSARRPQEQRLRALCWCSALAILVDFPMQRAGAQRTDVGVHDSRRAESRERVRYALFLALSLAAYKHARTRACMHQTYARMCCAYIHAYICTCCTHTFRLFSHEHALYVTRCICAPPTPSTSTPTPPPLYGKGRLRRAMLRRLPRRRTAEADAADDPIADRRGA